MSFRKYTYIFLLLPFIGCTCPKEKIYSITETGLYSKEWKDVVQENPIGKNENIKATPLFKNEAASHFIIQIRDREKPHIHETHDLTVMVKKGKGVLHLGKDDLRMRRGDIAFIPRGVLHYFVNTGSAPSVAYVIFTPMYDGKDMKLIDDGTTN
ncbi:MAG: cupin domain-containing protein [Deltaproteobacteria bacterium]|nr:cupin domain-containing protein [Deltaproteobacteria bacterium]